MKALFTKYFGLTAVVSSLFCAGVFGATGGSDIPMKSSMRSSRGGDFLYQLGVFKASGEEVLKYRANVSADWSEISRGEFEFVELQGTPLGYTAVEYRLEKSGPTGLTLISENGRLFIVPDAGTLSSRDRMQILHNGSEDFLLVGLHRNKDENPETYLMHLNTRRTVHVADTMLKGIGEADMDGPILHLGAKLYKIPLEEFGIIISEDAPGEVFGVNVGQAPLTTTKSDSTPKGPKSIMLGKGLTLDAWLCGERLAHLKDGEPSEN